MLRFETVDGTFRELIPGTLSKAAKADPRETDFLGFVGDLPATELRGAYDASPILSLYVGPEYSLYTQLLPEMSGYTFLGGDSADERETAASAYISEWPHESSSYRRAKVAPKEPSSFARRHCYGRAAGRAAPAGSGSSRRSRAPLDPKPIIETRFFLVFGQLLREQLSSPDARLDGCLGYRRSKAKLWINSRAGCGVNSASDSKR
jgi:hypothetical protein